MPNPLIDDGPQGLDWIVARTADLTLTLSVIDDETGDPEDVSGLTFAAVVVDPENVDEPLIEATATGGDGQIVVEVAAEDFTIAKGDYLWSLWQTAPTRQPWIEGTFSVARNLIGVA